MAENIENNGCSQRDNAEHEGYVKASRSFNRIWKERDSAQPRLLEAILYKDNFNRAYKRVKANKGAPGIDGMTVEEALPYLREHQQEITDRIYRGKYTPSPVRRVEIPKADGGVRKLGIPTVVDRTRKTDKQWLLRFSHSLSVCARQLLKAPYTERYVRCCERTAVSYRLLLDFVLEIPRFTPRNLSLYSIAFSGFFHRAYRLFRYR